MNKLTPGPYKLSCTDVYFDYLSYSNLIRGNGKNPFFLLKVEKMAPPGSCGYKELILCSCGSQDQFGSQKINKPKKIGREVKNSPIISIIAFMLLKNFYIVIKITLCQSNVSNNTCHVCTHTWLPEIRQPNTLMHCLV